MKVLFEMLNLKRGSLILVVVVVLFGFLFLAKPAFAQVTPNPPVDRSTGGWDVQYNIWFYTVPPTPDGWSIYIWDDGPSGSYPLGQHWLQEQRYLDTNGNGTIETGVDSVLVDSTGPPNTGFGVALESDYPPGDKVYSSIEWFYDPPGSGNPKFANGDKILLRFRACDGTVCSDWSETFFLGFDYTPPTSTIDKVCLDRIEGTGYDELGGFYREHITIQRASDSLYWDNSTKAWQASIVYTYGYPTEIVPGFNAWTRSLTTSPFSAADTYTIEGEAQDYVYWTNNRNLEAPPQTFTFVYDGVTDPCPVPPPEDFTIFPIPTEITMNRTDSSSTTVTINWTGTWDDLTTMDLVKDESGLGSGMTTSFATASFTKGSATLHEIVLTINTSDTTPGDYPLPTQGTATPPLPGVPLSKFASPELIIHVREPPWIKTTGSDVGAKGRIDMNITSNAPQQPVDAGNYNSIAIGSDNLPIIAYYNGTDGSLQVAKCNDQECTGGATVSKVDNSADVGTYVSITIGIDDLPVISYYDATNTSLKVAKCNDIDCAGEDETISTVDNSAIVGRSTSIAIGSDGFPVISYYDSTANSLKVAKCNDEACTGGDELISTVDDPASSVGLYSSIAIGSDGFPVISYSVSSNLYFAKQVAPGTGTGCTGNTDWSCVVVDNPAPNVGQWSSVAIDPVSLSPVIAYKNNSYGSLKYAKQVAPGTGTGCTGNTDWSCITLDDPPGHHVGAWPSLAFGTDNLPIISHYDWGNYGWWPPPPGGLRITRQVASGTGTGCTGSADWSCVEVDDPPGENVGVNTSLALGADGLPIVSYGLDLNPGPPLSGFTGDNLKVAKQTQGTGTGCDGNVNSDWTCTTVATGGSPPPPPEPNADYLVIADASIIDFTSAKDWLVESYNGGINTGFASGNEFEELWDQFGAGVASEHSANRMIPNTRGVYAYPSATDIESGPPTPLAEDFTWDGTGESSNPDPVVLFINGNLNIDADLDLASKKVAFIVRGNVNINSSVQNVDGFYVVGGQFKSGTCLSNNSTCQLTADGAIIALGGVNLNRSLGTSNPTTPSEVFNYDPSYLYYFAVMEPSTGDSLLGRGEAVFKELPP